MKTYLLPVLTVIVAISAAPVSAHDQIPGAPQRQPIAIRGATLHLVDRPVQTQSSLLFEDGTITAIGKQIQLPETVREIDGTGLHVYPGLFDAMTDLGLREISAVDVTVDRSERGEENPNVRSWVAVNPDSELIPVARAGGVLVGHVAPGGQWLRGQSAVMTLDGWTAAEMNVKAPSALCVDWSAMHPRGDDPEDVAKEREQKFKELDDLLDRARRYRSARQNASDVPSDIRLESLLPVIDGELPLIAEADRLEAIESAVAYAQSQSLKLIIYGGYDAAECADLLKAYDVPVLIAGTYRLPQRRGDAYDAPFTLPDRLLQAGVEFAICGEGPGYPGGAANARNLPYHAGNAVAYGLPREQAVRAITLSPAEILGVGDRLGSLTVGKDATLIVVDGDVLETASNVLHAFVQGRQVDLSSKHKMLYEKYRQKYLRR